MHEFELRVEQVVRAPLAEVFAFFADAGNLEAITPPLVGFRILTPRPILMREGARIDYSIRLHGLPIRWKTRINAWEDGKRFIDEQIAGPYRLWIHEHTFEPTGPDGAWTLVRDHIRYAVPGGPGIERLIEKWFVRPRLDEIFAFRRRAIEDRFARA